MKRALRTMFATKDGALVLVVLAVGSFSLVLAGDSLLGWFMAFVALLVLVLVYWSGVL